MGDQVHLPLQAHLIPHPLRPLRPVSASALVASSAWVWLASSVVLMAFSLAYLHHLHLPVQQKVLAVAQGTTIIYT
jgi:hypothetical protein